MNGLPPRQLHLDFHTPPEVKGVARDFDAPAFASRVAGLGAESVTLFARCHHGMFYYPSRLGALHPGLEGRDLMGEMLEALHAEGIRCALYLSVGWDEVLAEAHPDWRQKRRSGEDAVQIFPDPGGGEGRGRWRFLNWLHPAFLDFLEANLTELFDRYRFEGLFFDIVFLDHQSCWSETTMALRREYGYLADNQETHRRLEVLMQRRFTSRISRFIRSRDPECGIFYNSPFTAPAMSLRGARTRFADLSHWEIESLPSGPWGYAHFEPVARFFAREQKPWVAMTARFLKSWGDFGGRKPEPELEFECFRAQALGGAVSVGDHLPATALPDADAWESIGRVFGKLRAAEPFYAGSVFEPRVGILSPDHLTIPGLQARSSLEGAVELCMELGYDAAVVDDAHGLEEFELVLLPDSVLVDRPLCLRIRESLDAGTRLLASGLSGLNAAREPMLDLLPGEPIGFEELAPTFWREPDSRGCSVFYEKGLRLRPADDAERLIERVYPLNAAGDFLYGHAQAPPADEASGWPVLIRRGAIAWFADPVFREWRQHANPAVKRVLRTLFHDLIGPPICGGDYPPTVRIYPRRRENDLLLTLLHYPPSRKAADRDVIDAPHSFAGYHLEFARPVAHVVTADGRALDPSGDRRFPLPTDRGRLLLRVPGFYGH